MKVYKNPSRVIWPELVTRPTEQFAEIEARVIQIMEQVKSDGDAAIRSLTKTIDGVDLETTVVKIESYASHVDNELKKAIRLARKNIATFHKAQQEKSVKVETTAGVTCWRKSVPIEKVGLYIPGGSAPLFSTLLMLATPAMIAGCKELIICTPPQKDGSLHPVIGFVCELLGIQKVFLIGGSQAIAAMTYGTPTVPKVDKIFGPGNSYVTIAKQLAQKHGVAIDMPAGPSEVLVIADATSNAEFVAADLLSQAEHGPDSQVILISTSAEIVEQVQEELAKQLPLLPRSEIAKAALENSRAIIVSRMEMAFELSNRYAPEHLILSFDDAKTWLDYVFNAGSVFIGKYACESAGDYASGTNHTLPTNGYARAYSGVSLDSFMKKITFQTISRKGLQNLGPTIEKLAEAESLQAHKNAVTVRLKEIAKRPTLIPKIK
jgi:histidinol dehydrogenase